MLKNLFPLIYRLAFVTAAPAMPITGKVVGPDDKPVAGAEIVIIRGYDTDKPIMLKTDEAGTFKVNLEPIGVATANFGRATAYAPSLALGGALLKQGGNVINLERAALVQGMVQDKAGKPVADAIVKLRYVRSLHFQGDNSGYLAVPLPLSSKFTVKTDADGQWSINGVPTSGSVAVLLEDSRFARAEAQAKPGIVPARLTALPGANITGRVVHEDGTPAGGIKVNAYRAVDTMQAEIAADGTYTLTGLTPGSVAVTAHDTAGTLVALLLLGVQAKTGETIKIADQVLTAGALITGQVTDRADGTPLPGMSVVASVQRPNEGDIPASGGWHPTITDKEGHFKLRVAPGKVGIGIWGSPGKYLPLTKQVEIEIHKGEIKTVTLQLTKGVSLSGILTNPNGKPVANVEFSALLDPGSNVGDGYMPPVTAKADATGKWTLDGLKPGAWHLEGLGDWEVVSPKQLAVPLTTTAKVIVRPILWQTLKGRVTTPEHKPVAGMQIKAVIETPERQETQETFTDVQGQYAIEKLRPDATVSISAGLPGYKYVTGGKVTKQATGFIAQDLIMTPLTAKLEGRVVDTMGQPVADAQVMSPDGDLKAPVTSDAEGKFTLTGLPEGEVMVIAGRKDRIGEARAVNLHQPLNLTLTPVKLHPAHDTQRAYEILDDLWATTEGDNYYRSHIPATLAPFDPDLALKLATKHDGSIDSAVLSHVIINYAHADPAHAALWAPSRLNQIQDADEANDTQLRFALAIVGVKPNLAKALYQQGKTHYTAQLTKNVNDPQVIIARAIMLAPLARKLGFNAEADQFVRAAVAVAKATKDRSWMLEPLAALEYDETAKMIDAMDAPSRARMLNEAVSESAAGNVKLARRWLNKLIEFEKHSPDGAQYTGMATQTLIKALGKTDPAEALALARSTEPYSKPLALAIAAQFQTPAVALSVLHEAVDLRLGKTVSDLDTIARIAVQAYELDPPFGLDLFTTTNVLAKDAQAQRESQENYGEDMGETTFAFYYSRVDPAASRLLLEAEFARLLQQSKSDTNSSQFTWDLHNVAVAMAAIDVERALELSFMIPAAAPEQGDVSQAEAQRNIAQYLLLSESQRRHKPFGEWNIVDESD